MHVESSQPSGPRQGGRSDSARPGQRPAAADTARSAARGDVYEGSAAPSAAPSAATSAGSPGPDRLELSSAVRHPGQEPLPGPQGPETSQARAARVEALARDLAEGRLFSPERLQRAATRLLGGE